MWLIAIGLLGAATVSAEENQAATALTAETAGPAPRAVAPAELAGDATAQAVGQAELSATGVVGAWKATADVMFLTCRENNVVLGYESPISGNPVVDTLGSNDADRGMQPGMRLALSCRIDNDFAWEAIYFGMNHWSGGRTIYAHVDPSDPDPTLLNSPWTQTDKYIMGFSGTMSYTQTSQLQNAEFNFRCALPDLTDDHCWQFEGILGVRYMQWDERFNLNAVDNFFHYFENIDVATHNYLVGPQIGLDMQRHWGRFGLEGSGKFGLLGNFFKQWRTNRNSTGAIDPTALPTFSVYDEPALNSGVSGSVDASLIGTCQVTQSMTLRAGYQMLYVSGLALAPRQLGGFNHTGDLMLHGPTAGVEFNW